MIALFLSALVVAAPIMVANPTSTITYLPGVQQTVLVAAVQEDFENLRDSIVQFVNSGSRRIPLQVRSSFNVPQNYNPATGNGSPHDCNTQLPVSNLEQNKGLSDIISQLISHVQNNFQEIGISFSDIVSLAGKVAVEAIYPCNQIKSAFGQNACTSVREKYITRFQN
jgi:catalase (peroxidase I)